MVVVALHGQDSVSVLPMRMPYPIQEFNLTSILSCENCHAYSDCALNNSDNREHKGDRNVFHRHGVHPKRISSKADSWTAREITDLVVNIVWAMRVQTTNMTRG